MNKYMKALNQYNPSNDFEEQVKYSIIEECNNEPVEWIQGFLTSGGCQCNPVNGFENYAKTNAIYEEFESDLWNIAREHYGSWPNLLTIVESCYGDAPTREILNNNIVWICYEKYAGIILRDIKDSVED